MKRYYFNLLTEDYEDLEAPIPDGSSKTAAAKIAKKWMVEKGIKSASLQANSIKTEEILDWIYIEV